MDINELPKYLTIEQVCEILKVHPNTLRNWDKEKKLKPIRLGTRGDRRYEREQVLKVYHVTNSFKKLRDNEIINTWKEKLIEEKIPLGKKQKRLAWRLSEKIIFP